MMFYLSLFDVKVDSILLTLGLVWGGRLQCNRSLERCLDVNQISWIFVSTPKLPKISGQKDRSIVRSPKSTFVVWYWPQMSKFTS